MSQSNPSKRAGKAGNAGNPAGNAPQVSRRRAKKNENPHTKERRNAGRIRKAEVNDAAPMIKKTIERFESKTDEFYVSLEILERLRRELAFYERESYKIVSTPYREKLNEINICINNLKLSLAPLFTFIKTTLNLCLNAMEEKIRNHENSFHERAKSFFDVMKDKLCVINGDKLEFNLQKKFTLVGIIDDDFNYARIISNSEILYFFQLFYKIMDMYNTLLMLVDMISRNRREFYVINLSPDLEIEKFRISTKELKESNLSNLSIIAKAQEFQTKNSNTMSIILKLTEMMPLIFSFFKRYYLLVNEKKFASKTKKDQQITPQKIIQHQFYLDPHKKINNAGTNAGTNAGINKRTTVKPIISNIEEILNNLKSPNINDTNGTNGSAAAKNGASASWANDKW